MVFQQINQRYLTIQIQEISSSGVQSTFSKRIPFFRMNEAGAAESLYTPALDTLKLY